MGSDSSILCYRGDALTTARIAALVAGVVCGKLGDTTLAVAHRVAALRPKRGPEVHVLVVLEKRGRYTFEVASESELAALRAEAADKSLAEIVRIAWRQVGKAIRENRTVDTRPHAPVDTLPDDWLIDVAAALSKVAGEALYAVSSDHGGSGEYAMCRAGKRIEHRELRGDHERAIDRALRGFTGSRTAHVHTLAELEGAAMYLLAERGALLARPRKLADLEGFEPVL